MLLLQMIQKSASESRSVDFHRQFISGCQYEQPGRHPLSGNMYLDLRNRGLDEFQDDSDSGKCIPGNLMFWQIPCLERVFKPKGPPSGFQSD